MNRNRVQEILEAHGHYTKSRTFVLDERLDRVSHEITAALREDFADDVLRNLMRDPDDVVTQDELGLATDWGRSA